MSEILPPSDGGTRLTTYAGVVPTSEDDRAHMRKLFEEIMTRNPKSMVIYAEYGEGRVIASGVGSAIGLVELMKVGRLQIMDMLSRGMESGENG